MRFYLLTLVAVTLLAGQTLGQGRAFPVQAEEDAIRKLTAVNGKLQYDRTNFLVDLSGQYASCINVGAYGFTEVRRLSPEGDSINGIVDATYGRQNDVNSVIGYIDEVTDRWLRNPEYMAQVRAATRFGCSVRPGCGEYVIVACLFSPGREPNIIYQPTTVAFTPEQYTMAEGITEGVWDRDHFLENLSGSETACTMINNPDWTFEAIDMAAETRGKHLHGIYGYHPNLGSTEAALVPILQGFDQLDLRHVGCSLIADCIYNKQMYVVVSCLYETL